MVLIVGVRKGFKIKKYEFETKEGTVDQFIKIKSVVNLDPFTMATFAQSVIATPPVIPPPFSTFTPAWNNTLTMFSYNGFTIKPILSICTLERYKIATIGSAFPQEIKNYTKDSFCNHRLRNRRTI